MWTPDSFIKVQGRNVKLADLLDKVLYAAWSGVPIYRSTVGNVVYRANAGQSLGKLNSFFGDLKDPNKLWLWFYDSAGRSYYIPYTATTLQLTPLVQQGVKPAPTPGEIQNEANKPKDFGGAVWQLSNTALWGALLLGGAYIYYNKPKAKR